MSRDERRRRVIAVGLVASIAVSALYALAYFAEDFDQQFRYGGDNYQVLASIVADRNPGYFDADPVLGDPNNYRFYRTAFTALVDWAYQWLGNPGQVYGVLGIVFNTLRVFGFFLLGLRLFGTTGWAIVLAIAAALEVRFDVFGEWWGIPFATHARTAYESLFPYLFLGALTAGSRLTRQAATMAGAGAVTYFHPLSGPPVAFALWAAMSMAPSSVTLGVRLRNACIAGLAFVLAVLPYAVRFRTSTVYGGASFEAWDAALNAIVPEYMRPGRALVKQLIQPHIPLVFGLGVAGLIAAWRRADRQVVNFLAIFSVALAFAAVLVPLIDGAISAHFGRVPQELDFVRAAKYLTPMAMIGLVWGAKLAWENRAGRLNARLRRALVVGAALILLALNRGALETLSQVSCRASTLLKLTCPTQQERSDMTALYRAIERAVPKGELVFVDTGVQQYFPKGLHPYGIRIYSRRPVAWSWKEGGFLIFSNPAGLVEWHQRLRAVRRIRELKGEAKSSALMSLMRQWRVRYVVLDAAQPLGPIGLPGRILYRNARGTLLELPIEDSSAGLKRERS